MHEQFTRKDNIVKQIFITLNPSRSHIFKLDGFNVFTARSKQKCNQFSE